MLNDHATNVVKASETESVEHLTVSLVEIQKKDGKETFEFIIYKLDESSASGGPSIC